MGGDRGPSSRWRWRAGTAVLAIALAALFAGSDVRGSTAGIFLDQKFGWTLKYPGRFRLGTFQGGGGFEFDGAWVANFDAGVTDSCCPIPNMTKFRQFPADGAALMLWFGEGIPGRLPREDSRLPLTIDKLQPIQPYVGGAEPIPHYLSFVADGVSFSASVWLGSSASAADRLSIAETLASVRFPHLRAGSWSDEGQLWVLGKASSYPLGSITGFVVPSSSRQPLTVAYYLAHADAGFFVVQQRFFEGSFSCAITPRGFGFVCPNSALSWNAEGGLVDGQGTPNAEDMACSMPELTFDGTLLFRPYYGPPSYVGRGSCGS
jgi:hypothetical protein